MLAETLDEAQPQERAGFRQGFSCLDHIQTVSRAIEVCWEYRLPLVLTFVDYEKAFDSVGTIAILSTLVDQALCYAAETWADTAATSRKLLTTHVALERCFMKFNQRTQHLVGLRSSGLRGMFRLRDLAEYVSKAKHRWAGHIMRRIEDRWTKRTLEWIPRDAKHPRRRPPTRGLTCSLHGWTS
ncbi:hypothetical protein RB195_023759 [Necator americanus]|uniref:Reverse transcriptase domain-containing protein n=1 Tax=Necator americanus TaxID=51031 RepID=A0ABR1EMU4_NECAM